MKEILLTSSVLILALLALRQLFRRTVSRRMQYALWLLVLARLLVPVNVGTLAHNVLSAAAPVQAVVEERLDTPVLYVQDGTERRPAQLLPGKESQGEPLSPPSGAAHRTGTARAARTRDRPDSGSPRRGKACAPCAARGRSAGW